MNAAFRIGETELMADDGIGEQQAEFKGMTATVLPFLDGKVSSAKWAK